MLTKLYETNSVTAISAETAKTYIFVSGLSFPELLSKIPRYISCAAVVISVIIGRSLQHKVKLRALDKRTANKTMYTIVRIGADRILITNSKGGKAESK